jgi:hypothetical protein
VTSGEIKRRASSAVIGSPKAKPCAYSQPSWIQLHRIRIGFRAFRDDGHVEIVRQRDTMDFNNTGRAPRLEVRTNDWSILMVSNGKRCK